MPFELFKDGGKRGLKPKIKIRNTGMIYFNLGAIRKFELERYKYMQMYFDRDARRIGIVRTNDEGAEGKIKLIVRSEASSSWISAKSFFLFYDIPLPKEKTKEEIDFELNDDGMIILNYPNDKNTVESSEEDLDENLDDDLPF